MNFFSRLLQNITSGINKYYANTFSPIGQMGVPFDFSNSWAIETAYSKNPDVFAIVNQMSSKAASIPYFIGKVEDKKSLNRFNQTRNFISKNHLLTKADSFTDEYLNFPEQLKTPNALYGWRHFFQLYETYFALTGNVFIYKHFNDLDEIVGLYILPSNLIKIYLKEGTTTLDTESPIIGYEMIYTSGASVPFKQDEIVHIKSPNPEFGLNGENLYGFSKLKAAYYNINNVIEANKHLHKMFKSSGAFGFIFSKGEELRPDQADQFSEKIKAMDKSKERMAKISGIGKEIGFQRIALGNKDMQPWESLSYDRKTICNILGWRDELLNNDKGSSLGGGNEAMEARKGVLLDTIMPDLQLLEEPLTEIIQEFTGYENTRFVFDVTEMPEVQEDVNKIVEWAEKAPLSTNDRRKLINYEPINPDDENDIHNKVLIRQGMISIHELEARGLNIDLFENSQNNNN